MKELEMESYHRHSTSSDTTLGYPPSTTSYNANHQDYDMERTLTHAHTGTARNGSPSRTNSVAREMSTLHEILFVGLLCSAQFTTQLALVGPLNILHIIGRGLNINNPGVLSWLIAGYSLTVGSFILLSGRMGDVFGYKKMIFFGYAWFAVWSLVGGLSAWSGEVLFIFSRVLAGMGPAILLPNSLGMLGATYEPGLRKNMVFSLFGACAPSGAVVGGVFAGLWSLIWWPWFFFSFAIALTGLAILSIFILPSPPPRPEFQNLSLKQKIIDLDLLGATVGITGMILFNFAINQAPGFGWEKPYISILLIIGILIFPVFFWIEKKVATKPLIPFDSLSSDVSFVLGCMACGWASFGIWVYYFFQFLQLQRQNSPLLTIAMVAPMTVAGGVAGLAGGKLIGKLGPAWVMFVSMCAFLTGNILTATAPVSQSYFAQTFICTLIIPFGMDMSFPAATLILSDKVAKQHQGTAASLVNTVVNYSISIGVGVAGTVEIHTNNGGKTRADELLGYRGALYMSIGLAALGVVVSSVFLAKEFAVRGTAKEDVKQEIIDLD